MKAGLLHWWRSCPSAVPELPWKTPPRLWPDHRLTPLSLVQLRASAPRTAGANVASTAVMAKKTPTASQARRLRTREDADIERDVDLVRVVARGHRGCRYGRGELGRTLARRSIDPPL